MTMASETAPTENGSRIPVCLRRASSLRLKGERGYQRSQQLQLQQQHEPFPAITENAETTMTTTRPLRDGLRRCASSASLGRRGRAQQQQQLQQDDWSDGDSVLSLGSLLSGCSASNGGCEHAHFGLNGTTWSARSQRYLVHRSPQHSPDAEYLTPTQRGARQLRYLQAQLREARAQLDDRDRELARLTQQLVELRLRPEAADPSSLAEDTTAPQGEQQQQQHEEHEQLVELVEQQSSGSRQRLSSDENRLSLAASHFEARLDELQRRHREDTQALQRAHQERLEALLDQLAELRPERKRCRELEAELGRANEQLRHSEALLAEQEQRSRQLLLDVYGKRSAEQQSEAAAAAASAAAGDDKRVSLAELLRQLSLTQAELESVKTFQGSSGDGSSSPQALARSQKSLLSLQEAVSLWLLGTRKAMYRSLLESKTKDALDPEITLQFLKSAVYYFLTDKENLQGHLNAIESILGFTDSEKLNIDKIYRKN